MTQARKNVLLRGRNLEQNHGSGWAAICLDRFGVRERDRQRQRKRQTERKTEKREPERKRDMEREPERGSEGRRGGMGKSSLHNIHTEVQTVTAMLP